MKSLHDGQILTASDATRFFDDAAIYEDATQTPQLPTSGRMPRDNFAGAQG